MCLFVYDLFLKTGTYGGWGGLEIQVAVGKSEKMRPLDRFEDNIRMDYELIYQLDAIFIV